MASQKAKSPVPGRHLHTTHYVAYLGPSPGPHDSCVRVSRPYLREGAVWLELLGGDTFFAEA